MSGKLQLISILLSMIILGAMLPACSKMQAASGYTAILPSVLQSGSTQLVSISLFSGTSPAAGDVEMVLSQDNKDISKAHASIKGSGEVALNVPVLPDGQYSFRIKGSGFEDSATIRIENKGLLLLQTDKPVYKPGQTIQMRVITLDPGLMAVTEEATVEVLDAKGIKIFRSAVKTDEYGMATLELPVSQEPNLGTWKITAVTSKATSELDIKIEEYVLPKYEVQLDIPREWYLVDEEVKGTVSATYSFGKPVQGEVEVKAVKYGGTWQEYASIKLDLDGETDFSIPPAKYVAGTPASQGNSNVKIEVSVKEKSTGYTEKTDELLTISRSSTNLVIIPSGSTFKPGLPYSLMVVSRTPDNALVDTEFSAHLTFFNQEYEEIKTEDYTHTTEKGKKIIELNPPSGSVAFTIECSAQDAFASKTIEASYSPTGNFIYLEQTSEGIPSIGEEAEFYVFSTREAANFYYEVISKNRLVYSSYTQGNQIKIKVNPDMAPSSRLLVYQILPNSEVAADYLPFDVSAEYSNDVRITIPSGDISPGEDVNIDVQTEGNSEIGLVGVDKSVFILAENRMNLQQVFDELEKLYMNPQAELHDVTLYDGIRTRGASEVFSDAGVVVLSNHDIPEGKKIESPFKMRGGIVGEADGQGILPPMAAAPAGQQSAESSGNGQALAEVQRVRQYFPETWIWETIKTGDDGKASFRTTVPDTITTWMLKAVAVSKEKGLGIAQNQLKVFQPFFLSIDLPYSTIRGEEFPVRVAVYNYLDQSQEITVDIEDTDWFELLDEDRKTISVDANDVGSTEYRIRPVLIGNNNEIKVTARSPQAADAAIKTVIVEPEGVEREMVSNVTLANGAEIRVDTALPSPSIEGSPRAYLAFTSSYLTQTIDGLDSLIQMPFGCGEQNMIIFAPDVYITRYLKSSGQLKPEIMAKAEKLMLTGYQRELTYRRSDGSFSAFGESDEEGSLWLTAFVLKCFSEAQGLIYIDDQVLEKAKNWILKNQKSDGSFESVGFVHHQEMLGGVQGKAALTAYIAIALLQAGEKDGALRAVSYLKKQIDNTEDPYTLALIAFAMELAADPGRDGSYDKLMKSAREDENGLYWGSDQIAVNNDSGLNKRMMPVQPQERTSNIEATAYAALALIIHGDNFNASRAAKWLVSKRNAYGGFGSTQDTVMALQALTEYSGKMQSDVDLEVKIRYGEESKTVSIIGQNYDVLQIVDVPVNETLIISVSGKGEAIGQIVKRFNTPRIISETRETLDINVAYDADEVALNDEVKVSVELSFNPPEDIRTGMVVLDIAIPTGFEPVKDSIQAIVDKMDTIKRFEISGRKVIFYIDDLEAGTQLFFNFKVKAVYPVKARGVKSQAYSYYNPEIAGESLSSDITVLE